MSTLSEADQQFMNLAQKLIVQYNLGIGNRVGLVCGAKNVGDIYFFCAALNYVQCLLNKHYVVITLQNCPVDIFCNWQNANGADIEKVCLSTEELKILSNSSEDCKKLYNDILDFFVLKYADNILFNYTNKADVYQNLTRPKIPAIKREDYIEHFGLVPGKTVLLIPESVYMGTLPLYFWTMSIQFFKLLGYHVLVNSQKPIYGQDVTYCFPPLDDMIGLADECGFVYAIRTGLAEVIASETTAKVVLFQIQDRHKYDNVRSVSLIYPFIDNSDGHIVEITIPDKKEDFAWIRNAQETLEKNSAPLYFNLKIRDHVQHILAQTEYHTPETLFSYKNEPNIIPFHDEFVLRCDDFCSVEYKFYAKNDLIYVHIHMKPYFQFIIHIALTSSQTDKVVQKYCNYNYHTAIFRVAEDNEYYAVVHLVDIKTRKSTVFKTHPLKFQCPPKYKLASFTNYDQYFNQLNALSDENLLIVIVCKDPHLAKDSSQYSWLTVLDQGKTICQNINLEQQNQISYEWDDNQLAVTLSYIDSKKQILSVSIRINGQETAVDQLGINFVVWDKDDKRLLDSVCFDTYVSLQAYRV